MLEDSGLPAIYWEFDARTAAHIKNCIYSTAMGDVHDGHITPNEALWSQKPDLSLLKVWGSPAYVHIPSGKVKNGERKHKLDARARPAVFVGYSGNYKAWSFYDPVRKEFFTSRAATFNERVGDSTPTLTLLKQPQPSDLGLSELIEFLTNDGTAPHVAVEHDSTNRMLPPTLPLSQAEKSLRGVPTRAPVKHASATRAPVTRAPASHAPPTHAPGTHAQRTHEPATRAPCAHTPTHAHGTHAQRALASYSLQTRAHTCHSVNVFPAHMRTSRCTPSDSPRLTADVLF